MVGIIISAVVSLAVGGVASYFISSKMLEKKLGNAKNIAEKTIKDAEEKALAERCHLAFEVQFKRICDYIGSYYVLMGGCDAIIFTAGIGENSAHTRREVIDGLAVLGIKIDEEANDCRGVERLITTEDSSIPCYIIPTNEELMIARDTYLLYQAREKEKELEENEII